MDHTATADDAIRVYWMTGCSSCLRTKEFLQKHGVPFLSRNVLEDESAYAELERFGLKQVPIVTRGAEWVNGQVLRDVARLCDITYGEVRMLPVEVMRARLDAVLAGAARFLAQMPDEALARMLPNRPRSFAELGWHIANIADAFLEHEDGIPLTFDSYMRVPMPAQSGRDQLIAYCEEMRRRMSEWFGGPGADCDWSRRADVYYGEQTMHEFLERTVWHAGQHVRQLMWVLEGLGIAPDRPLGPETFAGLPMPEKVWDEADPAKLRRAP
ncbi:DinB family protein [Roseococcus suduntuyensis]|uniref:Glutaredoxin n=1 Tax=Roseococcus suduntuyensis TaxID=455361 RepID=A0A840A8S5_9PROT|nr:DinB family protein [Roseococcus suduntuyensis]MBB3896724.1 glutaredoxin [Roseococcus suduntuyensis]